MCYSFFSVRGENPILLLSLDCPTVLKICAYYRGIPYVLFFFSVRGENPILLLSLDCPTVLKICAYYRGMPYVLFFFFSEGCKSHTVVEFGLPNCFKKSVHTIGECLMCYSFFSVRGANPILYLSPSCPHPNPEHEEECNSAIPLLTSDGSLKFS
jgi:hypothetical protein